ncbi:uncharacterized protein BDZ83DRAFT_626583 [Colletotrichum acutatum]|uniref:Secreted protein n=1 Tax=Glomerella acutata TaxID=27357 RepID=A0AAD8XD21_GLOAC|nr:uncharacterized protein BDZ83DRAFT_626583 [Colletotrichum acutatum]KAK1723254.1 hypothetical protein BDZ83DRAFT_626583 [Colletotrichum acutatum]
MWPGLGWTGAHLTAWRGAVVVCAIGIQAARSSVTGSGLGYYRPAEPLHASVRTPSTTKDLAQDLSGNVQV